MHIVLHIRHWIAHCRPGAHAPAFINAIPKFSLQLTVLLFISLEHRLLILTSKELAHGRYSPFYIFSCLALSVTIMGRGKNNKYFLGLSSKLVTPPQLAHLGLKMSLFRLGLWTPRCSSVANAGGRPFCHELGIGWVHKGQWIFSISALSHELFWRKGVFCVFTL